jgi:hypothetical protein
MSKGSNIVHQYFKKEFDELTVLVRVNPIQFKGTEITLHKSGKSDVRDIEFDQEIFEDLKADGFETSSPLEFNLYYNGLA